MSIPKFILSLQSIQTNKMNVNVRMTKQSRKQAFTGQIYTRNVYTGCEVVTSDKAYFNSLCNTFGVVSSKITVPTDQGAVSFTQANISKYNITLRLA